MKRFLKHDHSQSEAVHRSNGALSVSNRVRESAEINAQRDLRHNPPCPHVSTYIGTGAPVGTGPSAGPGPRARLGNRNAKKGRAGPQASK